MKFLSYQQLCKNYATRQKVVLLSNVVCNAEEIDRSRHVSPTMPMPFTNPEKTAKLTELIMRIRMTE
ncbi:MAG: hypothetical protein LBN28_04085 [Desulfovibrio sp.]|nr:hypothetical protein [Desulfovibrio sp.]